MASRFILPYADIGNGISPSDGAQLFFYETGTSTPKDTYSDSAATTPNANPVIADSTGVFSDIFIAGTYKVVLKDKNDVQVWEADPVDEFATVISSSTVKNFATLAAAVADTGLADGNALNIKERTDTNGGGSMWDAVLSSLITENALDIVQCVGSPTISIVQRELARPYGVSHVSELIATDLIPGQKAETISYYDGWAAAAKPKGGATYSIATLQQIRDSRGDPLWVPDEFGDLTMANGYIAVLKIECASLCVSQFGSKGDGTTDDTPSIQAAIDSDASVINFIEDESYLLDPIYVKDNNKELNGNRCSLISASPAGLTSWALINVIKTDSPDLYKRPSQWAPILNVVIDNFFINYALAPTIATTNFNMIQINLGYNCKVTNCLLLSNFIDSVDVTRGSAISLRGQCESCVIEYNYVDTMRNHGINHVNRYVTGDFTEAAGEFGTATYATQSEFSGRLVPANTTYHDNRVNNVSKVAFDVHSYQGVSTLKGNKVLSCGAFFKNQVGASLVDGNYCKNVGGSAEIGYFFWAGYYNVFSEGADFPDVLTKVINNEFVNCIDGFNLSHPTLIHNNDFLAEDGFILDGYRGLIANQPARGSSITYNRFNESWLGADSTETAGQRYLSDPAKDPDTTDHLRINNNEFNLTITQAGADQARIIDSNHSTGMSITDNVYTERNAATTSFLIFCILARADNVRVARNTVIRAAAQPCVLAWSADITNNAITVTDNIGIGCSINETVGGGEWDINANNLLV